MIGRVWCCTGLQFVVVNDEPLLYVTMVCVLPCSLSWLDRTLGVDFGCKTVELGDRRVRLQMVSGDGKGTGEILYRAKKSKEKNRVPVETGRPD